MVFSLDSNEYIENNVAVRTITFYIFSIPIYKGRKTTTNSSVIKQLTSIKKLTKIEGFNNK